MTTRLLPCLGLLPLAACVPTAPPEETGCDYDGPEWVCRSEGDILVYQVDSCGVETALTERCLNADVCVQPQSGLDAFCGVPGEEECVPGVMPEDPVLGCNPEGGASGPDETTLSYMDECGNLQDEVAVTCAVGERCWYTWNDDGTIDASAGAHCASSMDPSQSDSPFYAMACDVEIYMHATTGLYMDCRCNRSNPDMQECRPGSDAWSWGLRLGSGPNLHGVNFAKWGGGFVHEGELYAAVHYTGGSSAEKPGAIYAIDLATGDRRVVSGSYLTDNGRVDVGGGYTPDGEALPFLVDIELGQDGMIYAMSSNTLTRVEITRVDPATGDRTLVWRRQPLEEASNASYPFGQCFDGRVSPDYVGGYQPVQFAERAFALGEDGSFYLGWHNDGVGVVRISPDGDTCTHVSRWASRNLTEPLPDIGGGVEPQYGTISGMLHRDGTVYAVTNEVMLAIDDVTGDRSIFSNIAGIGGIGETNLFVDETRDVMFACGTDAARKCSVHTMADGNVAQGLFRIGQNELVLTGKYPETQGAKGALDNNNYNGFGAVAMDPDDPNILYFVVLSGVIVYEIDTGNSHFISM